MMFRPVPLNTTGRAKAAAIANLFESFLANLEAICGVDGREMALVRTCLQKAFFFAERAMVLRPANHADVTPAPQDAAELRVALVCARAAHEANRAYCEKIGDFSQLPWDAAPKWQQESALAGAAAIITGVVTSPRASHDGWLAQKLADGWRYGPVKDAAAKTHPCMVPYAELPPKQRAKDAIFLGVVRAIEQALIPVVAVEALDAP